MPKKSSGKQQNQPKEGCVQNGSSSGTAVPDQGALVANLPPASVGEGNFPQDDVVANLPPASVGGGNSSQSVPAVPVAKPKEPNFNGGDAKPPYEDTVKPDHLAVARILASLISLKPLFSQQQASVTSRKSFKGTPATKNLLDTRFCVESSSDAIVPIFLKNLGVEPLKKLKKSAVASSGGGLAVFAKTTPEAAPKKGEKKNSSPKLKENSSSAPVVPVKSYEDIIFDIFGNDLLLVSSFLSTPVDKKHESGMAQQMMEAISSFLSAPTWEGLIALFSQSGGKATLRYEKNLDVLKYLIGQSFSKIEGEDARFLAKMRLFLDIMSAQNQKRLFESSRSHQFLYGLAIELLIKLGRHTKRISFDEVSSSHAAIVVLIFKDLYQKFDKLEEEEDAKLKQMLVQLFRTMTECFSANNAFLIEDICFDNKTELYQFKLLLPSQSTGLSHNSLLDCDLSGFMLDPLKIWNLVCGKEGMFAWIAQTGSGKSTLLLLLSILEAIQSNANVFYIGPETATMNPQYVATIIEVVCQFLESCGRERPVIRLNQCGVIKCEAGGVNVFMTRVVNECFPLLSSVFRDTPSIVAVDDNTQKTPKQLIDLFSRFNVRQLHICGSTIDLAGCGDVVCIGGDVASSVSFCAPTFMDQSGILPMSPDPYREFLLATKKLRTSWGKFFKAGCCDVFVAFLKLHAGKIHAVFESLSSFTPVENISVMDLVNHAKILYQGFPAYREFLSLFQQNAEKVQTVLDIVCSFTNLKSIRFVDLVKVARLLHTGFPAFQVGKVYSVKELNEITGLVRKFIKVLHRNGFLFDNERLQFPKDLSESQRQKECKQIIDAARNGTSAQIIATNAMSAYDLEKKLVSFSEVANEPIMSSSKGLSTSKPDDKAPTGGKASDSCSEDETEPISDDENDSEKKDADADANKDKKNRSKSNPKIDSSKMKRKPNTDRPKASSVKKPVRVPAEKPAVNIGQAMAEQSVVQDAASDAAAAVAADAAVAAVAGSIPLSADDAVDCMLSTSATSSTKTDELLTLREILKRIFRRTALVGNGSLPERRHVLEALSILCECGHPDSARWFKSFIYGVVLLDGIMPSQFIELCLEMFDSGRMIIILAYELFHLQSWNSKCGRRMKIIVANPVPEWHLRQTMARAGRLGTEHSGEISSWVSCLVLPNSDVSARVSVSEEQMPLMIENGGDICPIERAIMAMLFRGNFSRKHHAFIVEFLRLFRFVYRNEVCVYAFKGGRDYFMDFMRFISGVLVSKFVSPFECVLQNIEDRMCSLAFTKFRHGYVDDVEKTKAAFSNAMLGLVGSDSASMSLCLARAVGAERKFVGISHFDLPQLFKDLYERYPDSLTSFLKLIRNLLMNLQTMPVCKCDRTVDATVSAMLLVVTTTLDFVGDILNLLADKLREPDMERFRVGFVQEVSPIEQLRKLLNSKAGLPTLQDFGAFMTANRVELPNLASQFHNVCDFLSSTPSGPFHKMKEECQRLKDAICAKKEQTNNLKKSIGMPKGMKPVEWLKHKNSDEFKARCENVEKVQIPQLESEIRKLDDELASIEKVLGNLPTNLSEVVGYFQKLI